MRLPIRVFLGAAVLIAAAAIGLSGAPPASCPDCLVTRYWDIPSDDYKQAGDAMFPETPVLRDRLDLGITFSGGGTRSASASLGQLRGLERLGWLQHVKYVSAISGGAWAAIPFTYARSSLDDFLGPYVPPDTLTVDMVKGPALGELGVAIAKSSLLSGSLREGFAGFLDFRNGQQDIPNQLLTQVVSLSNRLRREGGRPDKTYARLLGDVFIDPLVGKGSSGELFSWDGDSLAEMRALNPGKLGAFVLAHARRPFLIASGSMVSARRDYVNPLLMPIEYTPMYVGVRQRFGRFGGGYVWPWAYDPAGIGSVVPDANTPGRVDVEVQARPDRAFTLADVAASTGAAPEVPIINAFGLQGALRDKILIAESYFPHFNHYVVNGGQAALVGGIAHADGGSIDNLGIMPLLARHVHNIVVFNNTVTPHVEDNSEMEALFTGGEAASVSTDARGSQVFDSRLWNGVWTSLAELREQHKPQVYCASNWTVLPNERFNIRGYTGLNICFVYNASADDWETALAPPVRELIVGKHPKPGTGKLDNFPYFKTFEQNVPHVIQFTSAQVNLLSSLTAWIVSNDTTASEIRRALPILPCPQTMTCRPLQ
jgi:hypothetical protein